MRLRGGEPVPDPLPVDAFEQAALRIDTRLWTGRAPDGVLEALLTLTVALDLMDADQRAHAPQVATWNSVEKVLDAARAVVQAITNEPPAQPKGDLP